MADGFRVVRHCLTGALRGGKGRGRSSLLQQILQQSPVRQRAQPVSKGQGDQLSRAPGLAPGETEESLSRADLERCTSPEAPRLQCAEG